MTKKKKIIIITIAVIAVLAAGGITIGVIHKNMGKVPETEVTKDTVSFAEAGTEDMAAEDAEAASAETASEEDNTAVSAAERDTEDTTPEAAGTSEDAAQGTGNTGNIGNTGGTGNSGNAASGNTGNSTSGNSGNAASGNGSTGKSTSGNSGNTASGNNGSTGNSGNSASGNNGGTGNSGKTTSGNSGKSTSGNSGNAASGNTGKTTSGNSGSSTCNHVWVEVLDLVHYDETGHYENVCVEDAWDEKIVAHGHAICHYCGLDCTAAGLDVGRHCAFCGPIITDPNAPDYGETAGSSWTVTDVVVDTIHHDAVYETQWVVDTPAHEEQVILYYECMKCGATKPAN